MVPPRDPSQIERYTQTKSKAMKKDISRRWKGKKSAVVVVLISNKIDFKTKAIVRDEEGHYTMIKGTMQQEDITLVNSYALNLRANKYVKQV